MKIALLHLARGLGLFAVCRWWTRRHLRILCYHGIWIGPAPHYGDRLFMSAELFAQRMYNLERRGYRVRTLDDALQRHAQGTLSGHDVVITIDDAWLGTYQHMVPELERRNFPATLYVTTYYAQARMPVLNVLVGYLCSQAGADRALATLVPGNMPASRRVANLVERVEALPTLRDRWTEVRRIAGLLAPDVDVELASTAFRLMDEDQIRDAARRGVDIQLHTHTHRMHGQDPALVRQEVDLNRARLSEMLGRPALSFAHFCYPSGEHDSRVFPALEAAGVRSATTTLFGTNPPGTPTLALERILDGESLSDIEWEAMLSGFWSCALRIRSWLRP